jgi:hypothetical protein
MIEASLTRTAHRILALTLVAFLVLGVLYAVRVPLFEKPDEYMHYYFIQHVLDERALPIHGGADDAFWEQEASQPPLYYLLAAAAVSWVDTSNASELLWLNPQRNLGNPGEPGNKNAVVHTDLESWPFHGAALAVYVARCLSLVFGAGAVWVTFRLVRILIPERPLLASGAAAVQAFIPQYLFIGSSVSNDSLITLLASCVLLQLVTLLAGRPESENSRFHSTGWVPYLWLGLTLGLASLAKHSGLALVGLAVLALTRLGWQQRSRRPLAGLAIAVVVAGAVAGWWYWRNLTLYGDWTATKPMLDALGNPRTSFPLTLVSVLGELVGLRASFWGLFGWFGILMPQWIYALLDVLTGLALAGLVTRVVFCRPKIQPAAALPVLWLSMIAIFLARWTLVIASSQGRLLFPAISAVVLGLALGWSQLAPQRWPQVRDLVPLAIAGGLMMLSAAVPGWIIAPAYALPELLERDAIPIDLNRLNVTYDDRLVLYGCLTDPQQSRPGDTLQITCYWEALAPLPRDWFFFHHLLGVGYEPVAKETGYPGSGSFPASLWPVGQVVAASEWLRVSRDAYAPIAGRVAVGVFDPGTDQSLIPISPEGNPVDLLIASRVKLTALPGRSVAIPNPVQFSVGDLARLAGYAVAGQGSYLDLTLFWEPVAETKDDLMVFVHLLDGDGKPIGEGDGPPANGDYPTTFWEPGETIVDLHRVEVPPGIQPGLYQVAIGLYGLESGQRLPVWDSAGVPQSDHCILLPVTWPAVQ